MHVRTVISAVFTIGVVACGARATAQPVKQLPTCDILAVASAFEQELSRVKLTVGTKNYQYTEVRAGRTISFDEPEIQIALGLLDLTSCQRRVVTITKRGETLIAPQGFVIKPVQRANGIRWNSWATEYVVEQPTDYVVAAVMWPHVREEKITHTVKTAAGKKRTVYDTKQIVTPVFYTPHSNELHISELVTAGSVFLKDVSRRAYDALRLAQVPSRAYPEMLIADVAALQSDYIGRRQAAEHMDLTEFLLDPQWTTERVLVIIGANRDRMAMYTCSPARACGPLQFTSGTYREIRLAYPTADLIENFVDGARDVLNSTKAAILLDDYNLTILMKALGPEIINDPNLEEYLAAAYNAGATRVVSTLRAAQAKKLTDWTKANGRAKTAHLLTETKGYIAKIRYLRDQWNYDTVALKP